MSATGKPAVFTVGDLVEGLSKMFAPGNAEPWDRTGLLAGDAAAPCRRVAVALDPTVDAVCRAQACSADVLLTHHPAYLDPPCPICPRASGGTASGAVVYEALSRGIALVAFHTALDVSAQAQDVLPGLLSLERTGVLEPLAHDARLGYGQVCVPMPGEGSLTLGELAGRCVEAFGRPPRVWGDAARVVESAVTWTGSAGHAPQLCLSRGIDVLVCGEVKYHEALDAASAGLALIELGHDVSELPFAAVLADAAYAAGMPRTAVTGLDQNDNWTIPDIRRAEACRRHPSRS